MGKFVDLTGKTFGRLNVIRKTENYDNNIYYICECSCGKKKSIRASHLTAKKILSCGCYGIDKKRSLYMYKSGEANFNLVYGRYIQNARKRELEFTLKKEEFREIVTSTCKYCGALPSNSMNHTRTNGAFLSNGIDRVNNNIGYTIENCVPCCTICNYAKRKMSKSDFLDWVKRVYSHSCIEEIEEQ
jgi:hypothetical protein